MPSIFSVIPALLLQLLVLKAAADDVHSSTPCPSPSTATDFVVPVASTTYLEGCDMPNWSLVIIADDVSLGLRNLRVLSIVISAAENINLTLSNVSFTTKNAKASLGRDNVAIYAGAGCATPSSGPTFLRNIKVDINDVSQVAGIGVLVIDSCVSSITGFQFHLVRPLITGPMFLWLAAGLLAVVEDLQISIESGALQLINNATASQSVQQAIGFVVAPSGSAKSVLVSISSVNMSLICFGATIRYGLWSVGVPTDSTTVSNVNVLVENSTVDVISTTDYLSVIRTNGIGHVSQSQFKVRNSIITMRSLTSAGVIQFDALTLESLNVSIENTTMDISCRPPGRQSNTMRLAAGVDFYLSEFATAVQSSNISISRSTFSGFVFSGAVNSTSDSPIGTVSCILLFMTNASHVAVQVDNVSGNCRLEGGYLGLFEKNAVGSMVIMTQLNRPGQRFNNGSISVSGVNWTISVASTTTAGALTFVSLGLIFLQARRDFFTVTINNSILSLTTVYVAPVSSKQLLSQAVYLLSVMSGYPSATSFHSSCTLTDVALEFSDRYSGNTGSSFPLVAAAFQFSVAMMDFSSLILTRVSMNRKFSTSILMCGSVTSASCTLRNSVVEVRDSVLPSVGSALTTASSTQFLLNGNVSMRFNNVSLGRNGNWALVSSERVAAVFAATIISQWQYNQFLFSRCVFSGFFVVFPSSFAAPTTPPIVDVSCGSIWDHHRMAASDVVHVVERMTTPALRVNIVNNTDEFCDVRNNHWYSATRTAPWFCTPLQMMENYSLIISPSTLVWSAVQSNRSVFAVRVDHHIVDIISLVSRLFLTAGSSMPDGSLVVDDPVQIVGLPIITSTAGVIEVALTHFPEPADGGSYPVTFRLTSAGFGCVSTAFEMTGVVTVTSPPSVSTVTTASSSAAVVSSLLAGVTGGIGLSVSRARIQMETLSCDFNDGEALSIGDSPTQMSIGEGDAMYFRGAAIGNIVVMYSIAVLFVGVSYFIQFVVFDPLSGMRAWKAALDRSRMPGASIIILATWAPTTVSSVVTVAVLSSQKSVSLNVRSTDSIIFAVTILGCLAPLGWLLYRLLWTPGCGNCIAVPTTSSRHERRTALAATRAWWHPVANFMRYITREEVRWRRGTTSARFLRRYGFCFQGYRRHPWYFVVELGTAFLTAVVGGLRPSTSTGCQGVQYALLTINIVVFGCYVVLRPFSMLIDRVTSILGTALQLCSSVLVLVGDGSLAEKALQAQFFATSCVILLQLLITLRYRLRRLRGFIKPGTITDSTGESELEERAKHRREARAAKHTQYSGASTQSTHLVVPCASSPSAANQVDKNHTPADVLTGVKLPMRPSGTNQKSDALVIPSLPAPQTHADRIRNLTNLLQYLAATCILPNEHSCGGDQGSSTDPSVVVSSTPTPYVSRLHSPTTNVVGEFPHRERVAASTTITPAMSPRNSRPTTPSRLRQTGRASNILPNLHSSSTSPSIPSPPRLQTNSR